MCLCICEYWKLLVPDIILCSLFFYQIKSIMLYKNFQYMGNKNYVCFFFNFPPFFCLTFNIHTCKSILCLLKFKKKVQYLYSTSTYLLLIHTSKTLPWCYVWETKIKKNCWYNHVELKNQRQLWDVKWKETQGSESKDIKYQLKKSCTMSFHNFIPCFFLYLI